jgi:HD-GYP domain-containing protein (c-di-GMP phosphodiesterase class II)
VVSLKQTWQEQRQQRQQEVIQRQQQVQATLEQLKHARQVQAIELRQDLTAFHSQLRADVALLRQEMQAEILQRRTEVQAELQAHQQTRLQNQIQLMQELALYVESLQAEVQQQLVEFSEIRQQQAPVLRQMLRDDRTRRSAEVAEFFEQLVEFRAELRRYCAELHQYVWGNDAAPVNLSVSEPTASPELEELETAPAEATHDMAAPTVRIVPPSTASGTTSGTASSTAFGTASPEAEVLPPTSILAEAVYTYLHETQGATLTEIEAALALNRFQTVDALRSLIRKGYVTQRDRIYLIQDLT